jgi:hypothetical protein
VVDLGCGNIFFIKFVGLVKDNYTLVGCMLSFVLFIDMIKKGKHFFAQFLNFLKTVFSVTRILYFMIFYHI